MNAELPSTPGIDPARRAAVRAMVVDTIDSSVASAPKARRRRVVRFASIAAAVVVIGGGGVAFAATQHSGASHGGEAIAPPATSTPAPSRPETTPTPEPTTGLVDPAGTPSPTPIAPTVDPSTLLLSAPVPAFCGHPAGTLVQGVLPGQSFQSGYVELTSLIDKTLPASSFSSAGTVTGIGSDAVAAAVSCNAGGVPLADKIVFYQTTGTALRLIGSYSLDTLSHDDSSSTTSVTVSDGAVVVTWRGPAPGQPESDGSLHQTVRFTVSGSTVVASDYTSTVVPE